MDKEQIIKFLNEDIESEHGAIIQYLTHAYAMGEGELSCEIEAIAREEMRHLDWLAERVVELGGKPSLTRGHMRMEGTLPTDWMKNAVLLEEDAMAPYREQIKLIDDPETKRLLQRILSDEEAHHGMFEHYVEKTAREGMTDVRGNHSDKMIETLNWGVEHEYTVVLQYMFQSYLTENPEAKKQLEDQAINEMQHLGWLAEAIIDSEGIPVIEHTEVDQSTNTVDMLRADIAIEKKVADAYDKAARETDDKEMKELLERIRDHEIYHTEVFKEILKDEE